MTDYYVNSTDQKLNNIRFCSMREDGPYAIETYTSDK